MTRLILAVHRNAEYDGYEYAYVVLTAELCDEVLRRRRWFTEAQASDNGLTEMCYWDNGPMYLPGLPEPFDTEQAETDFADTGWSKLPDGPDPTDALEAYANSTAFGQRTECDRMVVTNTGVYWTAYPKHCDAEIETREIPWEIIELYREVTA